MRTTWRWLMVFCLLVTALVGAQSALAQRAEKHVVVLQRDGDVTLQADGSARVVETWVVQFVGGPFRYAFRTLSPDKVDGFSEFAVLEDGQPYTLTKYPTELPHTYTVDNNPYQVEVYWYFPPTTDAVRVFQLIYTVQGGVRTHPDGDEFYWKFIEFDRQYPIEQSEVTVHLPVDVPLDRIRTATYRDGYLEEGTVEVGDNRTVVFRGANFEPYQEWEVRLAIPSGLVPFPKPAWQVEAERLQRLEDERAFREAVGWFIVWMVLIVGLSGLILLWFLRGRDRWLFPLVGGMTRPPSDLAPATVGVLLDRRADLQDVLATLFDLAQRGYVQIQAEEKDWRFIRLKTAEEEEQLRPFERSLMSIIFGKERERPLTDVKSRFEYQGRKLYRAMETWAAAKGLFSHAPDEIRRRLRKIGLLQALLLLVIAVVLGPWLHPAYFPLTSSGWGLLGVVGGLALTQFLLTTYLVPRTWKGAREAARWRAFRRYLKRLERYTNLRTAQALFEQYLPYAVAMGIQQDWVRKFAAAQTPAPRWYADTPIAEGASVPFPATGKAAEAALSVAGGEPAGNAAEAAPSPALSSPDAVAQASFRSLDQISEGLFEMLNTVSYEFVARPPVSSSSRGGSGSAGSWSGGGGWSSGGGSSSSGSSWSSGGGGSGGGSSGFG